MAALLFAAGCSTLDGAVTSGTEAAAQSSAGGEQPEAPVQMESAQVPSTKAPSPKVKGAAKVPDAVAQPGAPQAAVNRADVAEVQRLALLPADVLETSGLAQIEGRLWTLNDSGDDAAIYQLSSDGRSIAKTLYLAGARNIDWESLAVDAEALYIADCGNNRGRRARLQLYRVALDVLSAPDGSRVEYDVGNFRYGHRLEVSASDSHNFDCEAITAVEGELWLFSKNRGDGHTELYRLDKQTREQALYPFRTYPVNGLITAADYDPVSRRLVLLGYSRERLFGHSFIWIIPLSNSAAAVQKPAPDWSRAQRYKLSTYAQWEAISWDGPQRLVLSAERSPLSDAQLGEIRLDVQGVPLAPVTDPDDPALW
jgi:hypothetical protein